MVEKNSYQIHTVVKPWLKHLKSTKETSCDLTQKVSKPPLKLKI